MSSSTSEPPASGDGIAPGRLRRTAQIARLTARTASEAIALGLRDNTTETDRAEFHARTSERYAELFARSKGALMKAGQMLSFISSTPAVPTEFQATYQAAMARLRNDAPPMAPDLARTVLERELGEPILGAYAEFDWQPLAAASIGQVHRARLYDGTAVAVKIQYPGVAEAIDADLKNVELLATLLALVGAMSDRKLRFDLRGASHELSLRITEELDYRLEAANQVELAERYRGHPFIHVPEVISELCTDRVLTQELRVGRDWDEALAAPQELRDQWGEAIYRFTYGSFHRYGIFHADPHPGNYVFHDDGSVSVLDYGCIKRFSREQVETCHAALRAAYLHEDAVATWWAGLEAGLWQASDPVTPEEAFTFWREMRGFLCVEQPMTLTPAHAAKCIQHCSPNGPSANAVRNITPSPKHTIMPRIEMGVLSVIAQLHPTADWRAIATEQLEEGATPVTEMGKAEHAFFQEHETESGF